jgi:hypothetical protein
MTRSAKIQFLREAAVDVNRTPAEREAFAAKAAQMTATATKAAGAYFPTPVGRYGSTDVTA